MGILEEIHVNPIEKRTNKLQRHSNNVTKLDFKNWTFKKGTGDLLRFKVPAYTTKILLTIDQCFNGRDKI